MEEEVPATPAELGLPVLNVSNRERYIKPPPWAVTANVRYGFKVIHYRTKTFIEWLPFKKHTIHYFGSDPALNHFFVGHPSVESQHACVVWHEQLVCGVMDLLSGSGTFVNGAGIGHEFFALTPGDAIRCGKSGNEYKLMALPSEMVPLEFRDSEPHAYIDSGPPAQPGRDPDPQSMSQSPRSGTRGPPGGGGSQDFGHQKHNHFPERRYPMPNSPRAGPHGPNNRHRTPPRDHHRSPSPRHRNQRNNSASPQMNRHRNNRSPHINDRDQRRDFRDHPRPDGGGPRDRDPRDNDLPGHDDRAPPPHMGNRQGPSPRDNRRPDYSHGPPHGRGNSPYRHHRDDRGRDGPPPFDQNQGHRGPPRGHPDDNDRGFNGRHPPHDQDDRYDDGRAGHASRNQGGYRDGPRGPPRNNRDYNNHQRH